MQLNEVYQKREKEFPLLASCQAQQHISGVVEQWYYYEDHKINNYGQLRKRHKIYLM